MRMNLMLEFIWHWCIQSSFCWLIIFAPVGDSLSFNDLLIDSIWINNGHDGIVCKRRNVISYCLSDDWEMSGFRFIVATNFMHSLSHSFFVVGLRSNDPNFKLGILELKKESKSTNTLYCPSSI